VLDPLLHDQPARYQRHDWEEAQLMEWHEVPVGGVVVVEGVAALDRRLREAYDLKIWVEAPREVCLRRGLERDGEGARQLWLDWFAKEDAYWAEQRPREAADVIVDGSRG
jgi:uridine kinase